MTMDLSYGDGGSLRRVSPFRNPWINEYLLLTTAYRSLSRLSSALSAKAFTLCSLSLDLLCAGSHTLTFSVASPTHEFSFRIVFLFSKKKLDEIDFSLL